jgi:acetyl-CoA C-acetyltransferase
MTFIAIVGAARTPMGGLGGSLSDVSAPELGGVAIKAALAAAGVLPTDVDELLMGCVLPAGLGQAPARQAGFAAGLGIDVPATTVNKMCGSGMKTVMMAHDQLAIGNAQIMVAGGMESMSQAPYLLPKMRRGARLGHTEVKDSMFLDGLEDAYDKGRLMGTFAEDCAQTYQFTREAQDAYALRSLSRALEATRSGVLDGEIAKVTVKTRAGEIVVSLDEQPQNARPEKIPLLKPAFRPDGTVTAANASSISDGAAALVLATEQAVQDKNLTVRARILGYASHAQEPGLFTTAPIQATQKLLNKLGWTTADVDLWEVNEAFAVVPMAFARDLNIPADKLNIRGGACALGHPIGASGARIIVTLLNALETTGGKRGIAAICIGGGEATAVAIALPCRETPSPLSFGQKYPGGFGGSAPGFKYEAAPQVLPFRDTATTLIGRI